MRDATWTRTFSIIISDLATERSTSCNKIMVGLGFQSPNFMNIKLGMRLILAPRSHNLLIFKQFPISTWTVKLPKSFSLVGNLALFRIVELHSSMSAIVSNSANLFLLSTMSFMYLAHFRILCKTSINGKLICTYLMSSMNFWKHLSSFFFFQLLRKGMRKLWCWGCFIFRQARVTSLTILISTCVCPIPLFWDQFYQWLSICGPNNIHLIWIEVCVPWQATVRSNIHYSCQFP